MLRDGSFMGGGCFALVRDGSGNATGGGSENNGGNDGSCGVEPSVAELVAALEAIYASGPSPRRPRPATARPQKDSSNARGALMSDFFFSSSGAGTIKVGGGGGDHRQEKGELEEDEEEAFGDRGATAGAIAGAVGAPRMRRDWTWSRSVANLDRLFTFAHAAAAQRGAHGV